MGPLKDFNPLASRFREPEIMDDPALEPAAHLRALRGLERINHWSRSAESLWGPVFSLARKIPRTPLRVLDLACGGGDNTVRLWKMSRRLGFPIEAEGCDISPRAVEYAQERAQQLGARVRFFQFNLLEEEIPSDYDVLLSSLFFHHLSEEDVCRVLQQMKEGARRLLIVNDLLRNWKGFLFAYLGAPLLACSRVVHSDGVKSVRAAFSLEEVRSLSEKAGLEAAQISPCWPERFLLVWEKKVSGRP